MRCGEWEDRSSTGLAGLSAVMAWADTDNSVQTIEINQVNEVPPFYRDALAAVVEAHPFWRKGDVTMCGKVTTVILHGMEDSIPRRDNIPRSLLGECGAHFLIL